MTISHRKQYLVILLLLSMHTYAQKPSSSITADNWVFGIGGGTSFNSSGSENSLFRGSGFSSKMFGTYYFG
ncbi:hypothetical protein, partial [Hufsiella arboris]|uniref:hypothetical protein n=1 Tax=Hufsiella arboris TaxID=2695275 RepID=UPI001F34AFE3